MISEHKFSARLIVSFLFLSLSASASTTVNATLIGPDGNPAPYAYLQFDLKYAGYNICSVPSVPGSMVVKSKRFTPSQLPGTLYGNDEIRCGGQDAYSTVWHVTAYADSNTPIAGDMDYVICSANASLSYCPNPSGSWNLAQAQPFSGITPPPGFQLIFGNPTQSQKIVQPSGTTFTWTGLGSGNSQGTVDFTGIRVTGITGLGTNATTLYGNPICSTAPANTNVLTWNGTTWCGSAPALTSNAAFLQGTPISLSAGTANQVLRWISGTWTPDSLADFLSKAGGTMTGLLTLSGAPTAALHAATKSYVDTGLAGKADLTGGFVPTSELGSGVASASTCLLGNQTYGPCGGLTSITTNSNGGLKGGGGGSTLTLALGDCPNGNVWQSNGTTWACQPTGAGTITSVTATSTDGIATLSCTTGGCVIKLRQDCSAGQVVAWNAVNSRWDCTSTSGTPAGSTGQFQYNNGGAFAGSSCLSFSGTSIVLGSSCQLTLTGGIFLSSTVPGVQPTVPSAGQVGFAATTDGNLSTKCSTCSGWQAIASNPNLTTVSFSATPNFNFPGPGGGTFTLTLTGNVTSSTVNTAVLTAGQTVSFIIIEDSVGGWTFAWPSIVSYPPPQIATQAKENTLTTFLWNGSVLIPEGTTTVYP